MKHLISLICILLLASACSTQARGDGNDKEKINPVPVIRFDKDFYNYIQNPSNDAENSLKSKYPALLPAVGLTTINLGMDDDPNKFFVEMRDYFDHPMLLNLYQDAINVYNDAAIYEKKLADIQLLIDNHLTGKKLPELAFHVSGFKENVIVLQNIISVSIDRYLGTDYELYKSYFSDNQRQQMQSQMVLRDYLRAWLLSDKLLKEETPENLLNAMITEGKILYTISLLLSDYNKNDIIGYSEQQMAMCEQNEKRIWQTMAKQDNIFSTDRAIIAQYINEGFSPRSTPDIGLERTGSWIGWQIVNYYAKNNKFSLSEILNTDSRTILKNSRYNP